MKIKFAPYHLIGKPPFKNREGALLQSEFKDGSVGYSDVHPWPELGDKPLSDQLALLQRGITTPLTNRSLYFAQIDAKARAKKKYLFDDLEIPPSHWLLSSGKIPEGISTVKIKADPSADIKKMISDLPSHLKIRIDFNNKHTYETFSKWIKTISEFWDRIDFIEDPFPYNKKQWESMPVPLAGDFQKERGKIAVVKPAVEEIAPFLQADQVVITSYLDHPLGQLCAAYAAALTQKSHPEKLGVCGLLSHEAYNQNPFSERFQLKGACLCVPTQGTGFGFDDLLEKTAWL
jgi:O-succinylbenzoate synthase